VFWSPNHASVYTIEVQGKSPVRAAGGRVRARGRPVWFAARLSRKTGASLRRGAHL